MVKGNNMVCLADKKFTKKQILKLYDTIYCVQPPLYRQTYKEIIESKESWKIIELKGDELKEALDNFLLVYDFDCFTTREEAEEYISLITLSS